MGRKNMKILVHEQTKHGFRGHPLYGIWSGMVKRCENEKSKSYEWYGARGIKVCNDWRFHPEKFITWALENGYSKGLEIDRIDNDGDYCPENCKFITHKENCAPNKRRLRKNNRSGHRNICPTKHGTYEAYAQVDGKQKFLGTFKTLEDAIRKRDQEESNIHDNPDLKGEY